ncbi:Sphingosine N-acyltransferase lag1 [Mycoemilia scoparia]|uniref:Sphingosine N-acyltransferase lag1 n=1 Tax=Mycoemilia scoparia TaxID=417184 RepID=A0A9W8A2M8_9FUNG|nr:Sphingosine N-acyltransferase lag1 [Mycoemilia scoparia]
MQHKIGENKYVRGTDDVYFIGYWIVKLIFLRNIFLDYVFPIFASWGNIRSSRKSLRFCEVGWMCLYYTVMWTIGMKVMYDSPYWLNTKNLYAGYPEDHITMPYGLKWFYLVQLAFWIQNLHIIYVEERRKDHYEMLTHHFITIALVTASYQSHFTRWGHVFMVIMDAPDIFLTLAKVLRYMGFNSLCNYVFAMFTGSWFINKHYLCFIMMWSIWTEAEDLIPEEKRYPNNAQSYATYPLMYGFLALLCLLQCILIFWLWLLLKVLKRAISGEQIEDNRSDTETSEDASVSSKNNNANSTTEKNQECEISNPIKTKPSASNSLLYLSLAVCTFGVLYHYYPLLVHVAFYR